MGYLFLSLALLMSATKGYCGKKVSRLADDHRHAFLISVVRMLFCVIIGFFVVLLAEGNVQYLAVDQTVLFISILSGISTSIFIVSWLVAAKNGALIMLYVFLSLGVLVPLILSAIFFNEQIVWLKWVGVALLILASYIMCSYNNSIKRKLKVKDIAILTLSCFGNGATQFVQKWFTVTMAERAKVGAVVTDASVFNFYTYLFAFVILGICFISVTYKSNFRHAEDQKTNSTLAFTSLIKKIWLIVLIMAFTLFMHSYCSTQAASYFTASELYPLQQGLSLLLSMVVSSVFFNEKITKKCVLGIVITFIALITINVIPQLI